MNLRSLLLLAVSMQQLAAGASVPADELSRLRTIAFGSCADQDRPQPIWQAIVAKSPDLFLFMGDNVYADSIQPDRIREAYQKLGRHPGYRKLRNRCPVLATWDDHDYGINDGGREHPRKKEAQHELLDFFGVPRTSPRWERAGVYHARIFGPAGQRVQIILLDTRYHRDELAKLSLGGRTVYVPSKNKQATMLGDQQWNWLERQLQRPAELRLIVSSIQVLPTKHPFEKWANLPHERDRLFALLRRTETGAILILSGDQHFAEISKFAYEGFEFWEVSSSGLTHNRGNLFAPNEYRVGTPLIANNFGLLKIDWTPPDPRLTITICDEEGQRRLEQQQSFADLIRPNEHD